MLDMGGHFLFKGNIGYFIHGKIVYIFYSYKTHMHVLSKLKKRFIMLIPAYCACLLDEAVTIINQPAAYWNGDLKMANEANPIGATLMKNHVSGIFLISFAWLIAIGVIGYFLPEKLFKTFALTILVAHTSGAISWITPHYGFWYSILFVIVVSALFIRLEKAYAQNSEIVAF